MINKRALFAVTLTLLTLVSIASGGAAVAVDGASAPVNATNNTAVENTTGPEPAGPTRASPKPATVDQRPENIGASLHTALTTDSGGEAVQNSLSTGDGLLVTVVPADTPGAATVATTEYGTVKQVINGEVEATVPKNRISALAHDPRVERVRLPSLTTQANLTQGTKTIGGEYLRDVNKTGDSVRVAIIDYGIDPSYKPIADNVVDTISYTGGMTQYDTKHGDAVAEIVTNVAPDIELVLYSARSVNQQVAVAENISKRDDIDVVAMSLGIGAGGFPLDGSDEWSQAVSQSVDNETVWAVSAGNAGKGDAHYSAEYNASQFSDRHTFGAKDTPADLTAVEAENGEITGKLQWNEWPSRTNEFTVALYEDADKDGTYTPVNDTSGDAHIAGPISGKKPIVPFSFDSGVEYGGDYAIAVFDYTDAGSSNPDIRFNAFLEQGVFTEHPTRYYTITPPATDTDALTVGASDAYGPRNDKQLRPYSSRGPTTDGRPGIDVVGPDGVTVGEYSTFNGTSAVAPHAAGVVALVHADLEPAYNPKPNVSNIQSRITGQALAMDGTTNEVGAGHLDARRATLPQTVIQGDSPTLVTSQNESSVSVSTTLRASPTAGSTVLFTGFNAKANEIVSTSVPATEGKITYTATLDFSPATDGNYTLSGSVKDSTGQQSLSGAILENITVDTVQPNGTITTGDTGSLNASTADSVPLQVRFDREMNTSADPRVRVEGLNQTYTVAPTDGWVNATTYEGQYSLPDGLEGTATINVTNVTDTVGNPINQTNSESVTVDTTAPSVVALDAEIGLRETNVTLTTDEEAATATLSVDGPDAGTLTLAENLTLVGTQNGNYTYETTYNTSNGGDYTVSVTSLTDTVANNGAAGQSDQTIIAEEDKGTLTGTITGQATGVSIDNVTVELAPSGESNPTPQAATVYENGTYKIRTATGQYDVSVTHDEGDYNANTTTGVIDLVLTNTTNVMLDPKPASLEGSVEPADGASVSFNGTTVNVTNEGGVTVATPTLDANHELSVAEIEPGTYTVGADPADYAAVSQQITPTANESVTISAQADTLPAEASGSVTDNTSGSAPITATVEAVNNDTGTVEATSPVDGSGNYALTFGPGDYDLRVAGPMYEANETNVTTASNDAVMENLELTRVSTFALTNSISAPSSAEVGDEVTLEATVLSAGANATNATVTFTASGSEVESADVTNLSTDQLETVSVTYTVPESTADSMVSVTAATADSTTETTKIDVAALPDNENPGGESGGGGSAPSSSGGGSSGSGGAAPTPTPQPQPPEKNEEGNKKTASPPEGAATSSAASGTATFDDVETVKQISFETSVKANVTVTPGTPSDNEVPVGNGVVTGISAESDANTDGIMRNITFAIKKSTVNADALLIAHESGGKWSELKTTVSRDGDMYLVTGTADSFSRFVVVESGVDSENSGVIRKVTDSDESTHENNDVSEGSDDLNTETGGSDGSQTDEADEPAGGVTGVTTDDETPGFGVFVSVFAVLSALAMARVRP